LSEWHDFRDIGGYAVHVALVPEFRAKVDDPPTAYLHVSIGPRDEAKLRAVAKAFADRAINSHDFRDRSEAALALSYVLDPVAIPEMARVLASGSDAGLKLTTAMARLGGPAAIDALQAAAQSNPNAWIRLDAARELRALREGTQVVFAISD
jgi:HEAT repeat protein